MIPALIGAGASLLGGILGNAASAKQAARQMDFQREMSNTAHQREVADLRAAGLNPMLSAKLGGASTPLGAAAPQSDVLSPAVNTGLAAYRTRQEVENMKAQIEATESQASLNRANAWKAQVEGQKAGEEIKEVNARTLLLSNQAQGESLRLPNWSKQGDLWSAQAQASRASALQSTSQADLNAINQKLAAANIHLTEAQTGQALQILSMNQPWEIKQNLLSSLLRTPAGTAKMSAEIAAETVGNVVSGVIGLKQLLKH